MAGVQIAIASCSIYRTIVCTALYVLKLALILKSLRIMTVISINMKRLEPWVSKQTCADMWVKGHIIIMRF